MLICYELTMPNIGSWNGKWSSEGNLHCIVRSYSAKSDIPAKVLSMGSYYYNFGDGWGASVGCRVVDGREAARLRKHSRGFCGYDWMVSEIETYGRIKDLAERKQENALKNIAKAKETPCQI